MAPAPRPTASRFDLPIELLLTALLVFLPAAFGTVHAWSEMIATCIAAAIAVLLAVRGLVQRQQHNARWIIWTPIGFFILLAAVQLIPFSADAIKVVSPRTHALRSELLADLPDALRRMALTPYTLPAYHELRLLLLTIAVFAAVVTICRDERRIKRMLVTITLIGAGMAILALAQDLSGTHKVYWRFAHGEPAISGTFANHSHYGQFMNLSIAAALALLLMSPGRNTRTVALAIFIGVGWVTIAVSRTRGGVVSAIASLAILLIVLSMVRRSRWLAVAAVVAVLASLPLLRLIEVEPGRIQMTRDVWQMSKQFPLTGTGLGSFEWVFRLFDRTVSTSTATHADNEYLQVLAEMGWPGLIIVLGFAAMIWGHWLRALRSGERWSSAAAIGLGYGLLAVMMHSLTDFGQHIPAIAVLSAVLCGLLVNLGSGARAPTPASASRIWRIVVLLVVMVVCTIAIIQGARARRGEAQWAIAKQTARRLERNDWAGTAAQINRLKAAAGGAIAAEPGNAYYRYWSAVYHWRIAANKFARGTPELLSAARDVVEQLNAARRLCPTFGPIYSFMGQIEHSHLGLPVGLTHIETATRLEPNDPTVWFTAGRVDARAERFDEANKKFRRALELDYTLINDIAGLYLDDLTEPQPLIALAEGDWGRMYAVGGALARRAEYAQLAQPVIIRAAKVLAEYARRNPTPSNLSVAAGGLYDIADYAAAEQLYTQALKQEPLRAEWHAERAKAFVQLKRWDDLAAEIATIDKLKPDAPQLPFLRQQLQAARQAPK